MSENVKTWSDKQVEAAAFAFAYARGLPLECLTEEQIQIWKDAMRIALDAASQADPALPK